MLQFPEGVFQKVQKPLILAFKTVKAPHSKPLHISRAQRDITEWKKHMW